MRYLFDVGCTSESWKSNVIRWPVSDDGETKSIIADTAHVNMKELQQCMYQPVMIFIHGNSYLRQGKLLARYIEENCYPSQLHVSLIEGGTSAKRFSDGLILIDELHLWS